MSVKLLMWGSSPGTQLDAGNGGTISETDVSSPFDTRVGVRFNPNGSVESLSESNGNIAWTPHGSWIRPNSAASANFSVRYTNRVGTEDFTSKAAAEDTFINLGSIRTYIWNETVSVNDSFQCDFEVQDDVGSLATASVSYNFQITNV